MVLMIKLSLVLNVVILIPVCAGLLNGAPWVQSAFGADTPARSILMSVYMALLITSVGFLLFPNPNAVAVLLFVQVLYKAITPFAVGSWGHPVVLTNLFVIAIHTLTLMLIWTTMARQV